MSDEAKNSQNASKVERAIPVIAGIFLLGVAFVTYGYFAAKKSLFPSSQIEQAETVAKALKKTILKERPWYYSKVKDDGPAVTVRNGAMMPGMTLTTGMGADRHLVSRVIDEDGKALHDWSIDWFDLWKDADHLPPSLKPQERPGTQIHGAVLSSNGDLTFNFDKLGLVRMDWCGKVKWRLPKLTHHSVFEDESGHLWVAGMVSHSERDPRLPAHKPPFVEYTVLEVSSEGKVLQEISIPDLLAANGLSGLLHLSSTADGSTEVTGDTLHENDVEVFQSTMKPGLFTDGDIMISLRNVNTILVIDPATRKIKYMVSNRFVRQHDPDFIDGNTITVFDNNNLYGKKSDAFSRIIQIDARTGEEQVLFQGTADRPFFTNVMGKQQRLANGDTLVTEATSGKAVEFDRDGTVVWSYRNLVAPHLVGALTEATRLPQSLFNPASLAQMSQRCDTRP